MSRCCALSPHLCFSPAFSSSPCSWLAWPFHLFVFRKMSLLAAFYPTIIIVYEKSNTCWFACVLQAKAVKLVRLDKLCKTVRRLERCLCVFKDAAAWYGFQLWTAAQETRQPSITLRDEWNGTIYCRAPSWDVSSLVKQLACLSSSGSGPLLILCRLPSSSWCCGFWRSVP